METATSSSAVPDERPPRTRVRAGVAALGVFGAGLVLGACVVGGSQSDVPNRGLISDLAASLPKPKEQRGVGSDSKAAGCNEQAAYWSTRLLYNNLGLSSMVAGFSANAIKWGFDHKTCGPGPDYSCYTFHNAECHFDGCSWYEATTFSCEAMLHGETFVFENVREHCEVWAGIDAVTRITCSKDGLASGK